MAVRRSRPAGGVGWGEGGAAVTSPDGEEQNKVSLPLAGPADVTGRGRALRHRPGEVKPPAAAKLKTQHKRNTYNARWEIMVLIESARAREGY